MFCALPVPWQFREHPPAYDTSTSAKMIIRRFGALSAQYCADAVITCTYCIAYAGDTLVDPSTIQPWSRLFRLLCSHATPGDSVTNRRTTCAKQAQGYHLVARRAHRHRLILVCMVDAIPVPPFCCGRVQARGGRGTNGLCARNEGLFWLSLTSVDGFCYVW